MKDSASRYGNRRMELDGQLTRHRSQGEMGITTINSAGGPWNYL